MKERQKAYLNLQQSRKDNFHLANVVNAAWQSKGAQFGPAGRRHHITSPFCRYDTRNLNLRDNQNREKECMLE